MEGGGSSQPINRAAHSSAQVSLCGGTGLTFQASLTYEGPWRGLEPQTNLLAVMLLAYQPGKMGGTSGGLYDADRGKAPVRF